MVELFRKVALVEGVTTLLLFLLAMPLKYLAGEPWLVPPIGWLHGMAFIGYVLVMVVALRGHRVGVSGWARTVAAAVVPFGTFANDRWVKRVGRTGGSLRG